ncbi:MAG: [Clostridia bacterium]|nr:[citrate (pro-3S)-lyase] ligase [Clostridia bacterium]MBR0357685.1 [citrate (pro-3S)-lyase] ligase [Clostridia bacterium]
MIEDFSVQSIPLKYGEERVQLKAFLASQGLAFEEDVDAAFGVFDEKEVLVGCGCGAGPLLKCFAVAEALRGQNALGPLVSALVQDRFSQGFFDLYMITRAKNVPLFTACGFYRVAETSDIAMLENRPDGPEAFAKSFWQAGDEKKTVGAIVMNGNPFTLGHRYLIEQAAKRCDTLHVFVVEEDRSFFPAKDRLPLIREGTVDLTNVRVHLSGRYMISAATFPTYFLKENEDAAQIQSELDATLFAKRVAPALHITRRFVGEEPLDPVTARYNRALSAILPANDIEFIEVPRLRQGDAPISASRVRGLLSEKGLCSEVLSLVPPVTQKYLLERFGADHGS